MLRSILQIASIVVASAVTCDEAKGVYQSSSCCPDAETPAASDAVIPLSPGPTFQSNAYPYNRPMDMVEDDTNIYVITSGSWGCDASTVVTGADVANVSPLDTYFPTFANKGFNAGDPTATTTAVCPGDGKLIRIPKSNLADHHVIATFPSFNFVDSTKTKLSNLFGLQNNGALSVGLYTDSNGASHLLVAMHNALGANTLPASYNPYGGIFKIGSTYKTATTSSPAGKTLIFNPNSAQWKDAAGVAGQGPNGATKAQEGFNFAPVAMTQVDDFMVLTDGNEDCIYKLSYTPSTTTWAVSDITPVPYLFLPTYRDRDTTLQSSVPVDVVTFGDKILIGMYGGAYSGRGSAIYSVNASNSAELFDTTKWSQYQTGGDLSALVRMTPTPGGLYLSANWGAVMGESKLIQFKSTISGKKNIVLGMDYGNVLAVMYSDSKLYIATPSLSTTYTGFELRQYSKVVTLVDGVMTEENA